MFFTFLIVVSVLSALSETNSLQKFLTDADYIGSADWWSEFIVYSFLAWLVSRATSSAKKVETEEEKKKRETELKMGIKGVQPNQLKEYKTTHMAYTFYFYGGCFTGSHHVYLGRYTYALLYQGTLGFFGIGMLLDFFLMGVWCNNANKDCHQKAKTTSFPWRAFFIPMAFMFGMFMSFMLGFVMVPVAFEMYGSIPPYEWPVNPYDALGVARNAPMDEVKMAFRKTSIQYHPDKNPNCGVECEEKMIQLTNAYEILKKKEKKNKKQAERDAEKGKEKKEEKTKDWIDRLFGLGENGELNDDDRAEAGYLENMVYRAVRGWYLIFTNLTPDLNSWAESVKKKADAATANANKKKKAKKNAGNTNSNNYGNTGSTGGAKKKKYGNGNTNYGGGKVPDSFEDLFRDFEL